MPITVLVVVHNGLDVAITRAQIGVAQPPGVLVEFDRGSFSVPANSDVLRRVTLRRVGDENGPRVLVFRVGYQERGDTVRRRSVGLLTLGTETCPPSACPPDEPDAQSPAGCSACPERLSDANTEPTTDDRDSPETPTEEEDSDGLSDNIFPWAFDGDERDWFEGIARFVVGLFGALATAYLFLGGFLPSMGGKAEYEAKKLDLDEDTAAWRALLAERAKLAALESPPGERLEALARLSADREARIARLEQNLAEERRSLFLIGFPLYALLGGFFATAFAQNLLQALLIGFAWTAVADRVGLRREQEASQRVRAPEIDFLKENAARAPELEQRVQNLEHEVDVKDRMIKGAVATAARAAMATSRSRRVRRRTNPLREPSGEGEGR